MLQRKKHKCRVLLLQRKLKKPGYFKQEVYLNNKTLYLKGKLSRIFFSSFFRVIYPYLDRDCSTCNSYVQKSYKIVLGFTMIKEKTLKLSNQTRYARFFCRFFKQWEQNNLLEYKDKRRRSMPLTEKGAFFTEPVCFSHPISIKCWSKHTIGHLVKKNMHYVCAHTPVTLCTIEGIGKKKKIKREKRENSTAVVRMWLNQVSFV